ncbi:unnamed protein product [Amoebophrya sp. A120]|nr:unnamed protein product [Amoebophrya sp. A120]|eukprot:GSA120T00002686001.1
MVATWKGDSPEDAILNRIKERIAAKKPQVSSFGFLRSNFAERYVQIFIPKNTPALITVDGKSGSITQPPDSELTRRGVVVGDVVVLTVESDDPSRIGRRLGDSSADRHVLVFRPDGSSAASKTFTKASRDEDFVVRDLPKAWREKSSQGYADSEKLYAKQTQESGAGATTSTPQKSLEGSTTSPAIVTAPPAPGGPPAPAEDKQKTPGPYLRSMLAMVKDPKQAGITGWSQGTIDTAVLDNSQMSSVERFHKLFGFDLDWAEFPLVRCSSISSDPASRAQRAKIAVGDLLLVCGGSTDRVTLSATWGGTTNDLESAILARIQERIKEKKPQVATFIFLTAASLGNYVQLTLPVKKSSVEDDIGVEAWDHDATRVRIGKLTASSSTWARRHDLAVGDEIIVSNDLVVETDTAAFIRRVGRRDQEQRLLVRRPSGPFSSVTRASEDFLTRPLPDKWKVALATRPQVARASSSSPPVVVPEKRVVVATPTIKESQAPAGRQAAEPRAETPAPSPPHQPKPEIVSAPVTITATSPQPGAAPTPQMEQDSTVAGKKKKKGIKTKSEEVTEGMPSLYTKRQEQGRFLWHLLADSKRLQELGFYTFSIPTLPEVLNATVASPSKSDGRLRFVRTFGFDLDWLNFPVVRVSSVQLRTPRSRDPSFATKHKVKVGDYLICCVTLRDRVTLLATWRGKDPFDAILGRVAARQKERKDPVCSFLFLSGEMRKNFLQLVATSVGDFRGDLGFQVVDGTGAVGGLAGVSTVEHTTRTGVGTVIKTESMQTVSFSSTFQLQQKDEVFVAVGGTTELLVEKDWRKMKTLLSKDGPRPLYLLLRRKAGFPEEELVAVDADISRALPQQWAVALSAQPPHLVQRDYKILADGDPSMNKAPAEKNASGADDGQKKARLALAPARPPFLLHLLDKTALDDRRAQMQLGLLTLRLDTPLRELAQITGGNLSGRDKLLKTFGLELDWAAFPRVTIDRVEPASAAERAGTKPGDVLVALCGAAVPTMASWPGEDPDDAVYHKLIATNTVRRALSFVQENYVTSYWAVQILGHGALACENDVRAVLDTRGVIRAVPAASWAEREGLQVDDKIIVIADQLIETGPTVQNTDAVSVFIDKCMFRDVVGKQASSEVVVASGGGASNTQMEMHAPAVALLIRRKSAVGTVELTKTLFPPTTLPLVWMDKLAARKATKSDSPARLEVLQAAYSAAGDRQKATKQDETEVGLSADEVPEVVTFSSADGGDGERVAQRWEQQVDREEMEKMNRLVLGTQLRPRNEDAVAVTRARGDGGASGLKASASSPAASPKRAARLLGSSSAAKKESDKRVLDQAQHAFELQPVGSRIAMEQFGVASGERTSGKRGFPSDPEADTLSRVQLDRLAKEAAVFATDSLHDKHAKIAPHQGRARRDEALFSPGKRARRSGPPVQLRLFQERNKAGRTWNQEAARCPTLLKEMWKRTYISAKTGRSDRMLRPVVN